MSPKRSLAIAGVTALFLTIAAASSEAKDKVRVGFIGPLTGGVSVNGIGGRNSADLAVKLRDADGTVVIGGEHHYPIAPVEAS